MGRIVEYKLKSGSVFVEESGSEIDTETIEEAGILDHFRLKSVEAKVPFDKAIQSMEPAARAILEQLKDLGAQNVAVEMGFSLKGGVAAVVVANAEASFKVTLTWNGLGGTNVATGRSNA
jgi:hypothetical protein